ncbi:hypothetical protein KBZ00_11985 [Streptomyces sp. RK31]|uniref:hypothetical protein n=1 Tax=Streptomyces sp. RK31 TaxID=2824892 RepID=UPI001B38A812|nr:hypothetical protein [Streptomyces sp. RK31]MBQ0971860.1 hypothetical protein [Streptomyces sp. RK31]
MLTQHPHSSGEAGPLCTLGVFDRALESSLHTVHWDDEADDGLAQAAAGRSPGVTVRVAACHTLRITDVRAGEQR